MATTVACRECGDSFTISPEHLGRKYRCKSCGTVNVAEESKPRGDRKRKSSTDAARRKPSQRTSQKPRQPQKKRRPKPAPEPTYDEYSYDYDEAEYESYETYEDYDAAEEYQPSRSRSRRSSGKKKRSSSGVSLPSIPWKKIGGLVGTALLVLFIGGRVLRVVLNVGRAIGDVQSGEVALTEQLPAGAGFQILMPGTPRFAELDVPGYEPGTTIHGETWTSPPSRGGLQVAVKRFPRPSEMVLDEDEFLTVVVAGLRQDLTLQGGSITDEAPSRLAGRKAREMSIRIPVAKDGIGIQRIALGSTYVWFVWVAADDQSIVTPSLCEEVFNSFQLLNTETRSSGTDRSTELTQAPATAAAVARMNQGAEELEPQLASSTPENQQTATGLSFDSQRLQFKTRLVRQGPSPQPYENEAPPAGVEKVKYQSEGRDLMAWFARPSDAQGDVPAVVYLHGGFAFGASDFQDARPFLNAGFAVMTPTLRGENGNPGYFEMLGGEYVDACNAVRWLGQQSGIDSEHIYAFGHSTGGGLSALLSLAEDIPLKSSGSSGGLYPPQVFQAWADDCPFDPADSTECRMRLLFGNEQSMQRPHLAYLGATDEISSLSAPFIDRTGLSVPNLKTLPVAGDHFSSLKPAIMVYIQAIQADVLQSGGNF